MHRFRSFACTALAALSFAGALAPVAAAADDDDTPPAFLDRSSWG